MIGGFEGEVVPPPRFSRRTLLKAGAAAAAGVGVFSAVDSATRLGLSRETSTSMWPATSNGDILSVCTPGMLANAAYQTAPILPLLRAYGDTMLVQPYGERYSQTKTVEHVAEAVYEQMRTRAYARVVFNGISLGGLVAADALRMLHENRSFDDVSVEPAATVIDAPTRKADLATWIQRVGGHAVSLPPYGAIANGMAPQINWVSPVLPRSKMEVGVDAASLERSIAYSNDLPLSMWRDQVRAITSRAPLVENSLDFLASFAYIESRYGDDVINPISARSAWFQAVGEDTKMLTVLADMPHAGLEIRPSEARKAVFGTYEFHTAA